MFKTTESPRVTVRHEYSEESIWRDALGNSEPLLVAVTHGPLDAPQWMPGGSMSSHRIESIAGRE